MKQWIADILAPLSRNLYEVISAIPIGAVRIMVFGILAALAVWVLLLPRQLPEKADSGKISTWSDLRIFALFVLVLQAVLYLVF